MSSDWQRMVALAAALSSGVVFGLGLALAGMLEPEKVLAFLDVTGAWDPSLGLVMAGAIGVGAVAFALAKPRTRTVIGLPLQLPARRAIDLQLVLGSAAFGVGWGLSGLCPGPAVVSLAAGHVEVLGFVISMMAGLAMGDLFVRRSSRRVADQVRAEESAAR